MNITLGIMFNPFLAVTPQTRAADADALAAAQLASERQDAYNAGIAEAKAKAYQAELAAAKSQGLFDAGLAAWTGPAANVRTVDAPGASFILPLGAAFAAYLFLKGH